MDFMEIVSVFLRFAHVMAGIIWVGFVFFIGFVFSPAVASLEGPVRSGAYKAIMERTIHWIRPVVLIAYLTGIILLATVYHARGVMFEPGTDWGPSAVIATVLPFLLFLPYDKIASSRFGSNGAVMGSALIVSSMGLVLFMEEAAEMTYGAAMIHLGLFYGTVMAANVFMRVLPAQRRILSAFGDGKAPDPPDVLATQMRAKHNIYMALPLIWTMLNVHTFMPGSESPLWFLGVLVASIALITSFFRRSRTGS